MQRIHYIYTDTLLVKRKPTELLTTFSYYTFAIHSDYHLDEHFNEHFKEHIGRMHCLYS